MHLLCTFFGTLLIGTIVCAPATTTNAGQQTKHQYENSKYRHRRASSMGSSLLRKRPPPPPPSLSHSPPSSTTNLRAPLYGTVNTNNPYSVSGNLSTNLLAGGYIESSAANPNYWIADRYHGDTVCLLAAFSGTVRVRPSNSSFRGDTFHVSPEVSLGRRANCERHSKHIFWKFSQYDERLLTPDTGEDDDDDSDDSDDDADDSDNNNNNNNHSASSTVNGTGSGTVRTPAPIRRAPKKGPQLIPIEISNRQLSVGFHIVGPLVEFHVAYIECLQQAEKNVDTQRFRVYSDPYCVNLSVSFDIGSFGDRAGFECTHIWGKTVKDVHYTRDRRFYAGEAQISLEFVRIDRDPILAPSIGGYSFRKNRRRCLADTLLSWQSLAITGSLFTVFLIGFFGLCVCSNSSCSDDLSPGSYSSDTGCCSCCYDGASVRHNFCDLLSRILCFCFGRRRRLSTRRGHGRRGELLNRSTYERDLLDRSTQSEHHNHVNQLDGHQCHAHHHHHHNHHNHNHSTIGGHHNRHYGNHRHTRRPAPPPLLPPPPPPPPPSSSSTGTTHVDSAELLVLPVGQTSDCQVLLEQHNDHDTEYDNIIEFDDNCECIDNKLIIVQSSLSLSSSYADRPTTMTPDANKNGDKRMINFDHYERHTMSALLHYFCACFLLSVAVIQYTRHYSITVQYHSSATDKPFDANKSGHNQACSPIRLSLSASKYRPHNGSNDHVRGLH